MLSEIFTKSAPSAVTSLKTLPKSCYVLLHWLQISQNNAAQLTARLIYWSSKFVHVTPLFPTPQWLQLEKQIDFKDLSLCFKSLSASSPKYISDFQLCTPSRQLSSSSDTHLSRIQSFHTKTFGQPSFSYEDPSTWDQQPLTIRHANSFQVFTQNLCVLLSFSVLGF